MQSPESRSAKPPAPDIGELVSQVEHLGRIVVKARPVDPQLDYKFRCASSLLEANDSICRIARDPAGIAVLADAVNSFYAQPLWQQTRILNGWRPQPIRPRKDEVMESPEIGDVHRVVKLFFGEGEPSIFHDYELRDESTPVRIIIREGTSQGKTVHALKEALDRVERHWRELVDQAVDVMQFGSLLEAAEALAKKGKPTLGNTSKWEQEEKAIKAIRKPTGKPKVSEKVIGNAIAKAVKKAVGSQIRPLKEATAA